MSERYQRLQLLIERNQRLLENQRDTLDLSQRRQAIQLAGSAAGQTLSAAGQGIAGGAVSGAAAGVGMGTPGIVGGAAVGLIGGLAAARSARKARARQAQAQALQNISTIRQNEGAQKSQSIQNIISGLRSAFLGK